MTDTNVDQLRINEDMKDEGGIEDSSSLANNSKSSLIINGQHSDLLSKGGADVGNCNGGAGGGCCFKEVMTNTSRVSKKAPKKKKNMCYFAKCTNAASKFIGDCNFCKGHFCSKHRIMENHACEGLTSCREVMHKRNADKLAAEQTRAPKIQI